MGKHIKMIKQVNHDGIEFIVFVDFKPLENYNYFNKITIYTKRKFLCFSYLKFEYRYGTEFAAPGNKMFYEKISLEINIRTDIAAAFEARKKQIELNEKENDSIIHFYNWSGNLK